MIDPHFVVRYLDGQPLTPEQRRYAVGVAQRMLGLVMQEVIDTPPGIAAAVIIVALTGTLAACLESQRGLTPPPPPPTSPPPPPAPPSTSWN